MNPRQTNQLLGYPPEARLLIVNADDFGMCNAINEAIIRSLQAGVVRTTSLMVPCPWALHAMHFLKNHPEYPFGIHLTVICDANDYLWRPVASREKVPSLIDETGHLSSAERMPEFLMRARLDQLEVEFRAQIEAVVAYGLEPSHLDWHYLPGAGRPDIYDLIFRLAREYGLAMRATGRQMIEKIQLRDLPTNDYDLLDSFRLDPFNKAGQYARLLHDLPAGLSEWAVHPGLDNPELLAIEPDGNHVRQTDHDFWCSPQAKELVEEQGIILLDYRALQKAWRENST